MKFRSCFFLFVFASVLCVGYTAEAAFTIQNGRFINADLVATHSPEEHFALGMESMEHCHWKDAALQFAIVTANFPNTTVAQEAYYHLGIAEFNMCEFDYANDAFSSYLKCQNNPPYFLSAIEYKFQIAEKFRCGARRRFLGSKRLPRWSTGRTMALKIYDEIIAAVPSSEMAAQALYSKGCLLWTICEYRDSIEAFQLLCKRFPKSEMAPDCFLIISRIYVDLCRSELQNPDILAFAQLNAKKFRMEFPKEERLYEADYNVNEIKELYAGGLYDTGQFYERVGHPNAAIIYYYSGIYQFPETLVAQMCKSRLYALDPSFNEDSLPASKSSTEDDHENELDA